MSEIDDGHVVADQNNDYFEVSDDWNYDCRDGEDWPWVKESHAKEFPAVLHKQRYRSTRGLTTYSFDSGVWEQKLIKNSRTGLLRD